MLHKDVLNFLEVSPTFSNNAASSCIFLMVYRLKQVLLMLHVRHLSTQVLMKLNLHD